MKKIFVVLLGLGLTFGAFAQHGNIGHAYYYRPHVVLGLGAYAPFYPYYGFGYSPFYPYPGYAVHRQSKLDQKITDIRNDYADKITSAKSDTTVPRKERRANVHRLKTERDQAIDDLKRNYYKS
jgi:hypothetical protein